MSRRQQLLVGLLAVVALWAAFTFFQNRHWFIPASPHNIQIELSGTPGLKVDAKFEVDGTATRESVTIPAKFTFRVRKLTYTFTKGDQPGELVATVTVDGTKSGHTGGAVKSVRGEIEDGKVVTATADPN